MADRLCAPPGIAMTTMRKLRDEGKLLLMQVKDNLQEGLCSHAVIVTGAWSHWCTHHRFC